MLSTTIKSLGQDQVNAITATIAKLGNAANNSEIGKYKKVAKDMLVKLGAYSGKDTKAGIMADLEACLQTNSDRLESESAPTPPKTDKAIAYPIPTNYQGGTGDRIWEVKENIFACLKDGKTVGLEFTKDQLDMAIAVGMVGPYKEPEAPKVIVKTVMVEKSKFANPYPDPYQNNEIVEFSDRYVSYYAQGNDGSVYLMSDSAKFINGKSWQSSLGDRPLSENKTEILTNAYVMGALTLEQWQELNGIKVPKLVTTTTNSKKKDNDNAVSNGNSGKGKLSPKQKFNRYLGELVKAKLQHNLQPILDKMANGGVTEDQLKAWMTEEGEKLGYFQGSDESWTTYKNLFPTSIRSLHSHLNFSSIKHLMGYEKNSNGLMTLKTSQLPTKADFNEELFDVITLPSQA